MREEDWRIAERPAPERDGAALRVMLREPAEPIERDDGIRNVGAAERNVRDDEIGTRLPPSVRLKLPELRPIDRLKPLGLLRLIVRPPPTLLRPRACVTAERVGVGTKLVRGVDGPLERWIVRPGVLRSKRLGV